MCSELNIFVKILLQLNSIEMYKDVIKYIRTSRSILGIRAIYLYNKI